MLDKKTILKELEKVMDPELSISIKIEHIYSLR